MSSSSFESSAPGLVATAWQANGLAGDDAIDQSEVTPVPLPDLAERVARLAPRMPAKDRLLFRAAFMQVWPKIEAHGIAEPNYLPIHDSTPKHEVVLMRWIGVIVARRTPVASSARRLIAEGEAVAYPEEYEIMKRNPFAFGDRCPTGLRVDWFGAFQLTHRQLALHVEFAPLLAAAFLASRLPGNLINGKLLPTQGTRPQLLVLLDVLLARRPDNMTDERFLPCVQWMLRSRLPLWPDFDQHIVG
jgi:hypothetical protein